MEKEIKVLSAWKVDLDEDWNIVLKDCQKDTTIILATDNHPDDTPADIAVQHLNRQGVHITHYALDSDFSVILLAEK